MKNFLYIAFIILTAAGCKPGIPHDIIQPDKMALVLHDIHIADGYIATGAHLNKANVDTTKLLAASYYKGIYKKFGIDSVLYNKSMDYYLKNPKVLDEIYEKVTAGLTQQKAVIVRIDSLKNAAITNAVKLKMRTDSINKADSIFWNHMLLRDTTKKKINIIKPVMDFKKLIK